MRLTVADSGIGIDEQDLPRLFEQFFRAGTALSAGIPGTGLGLSVCRALAEAHGGGLVVASIAGRGTTFTLDLPTGTPPGRGCQVPPVWAPRRSIDLRPGLPAGPTAPPGSPEPGAPAPTCPGSDAAPPPSATTSATTPLGDRGPAGRRRHRCLGSDQC